MRGDRQKQDLCSYISLGEYGPIKSLPSRQVNTAQVSRCTRRPNPLDGLDYRKKKRLAKPVRSCVDIGTASWPLQSVLYCEQGHQGASPQDIIAFGDFVNHAFFIFAEFVAASGFLLEQRFIAADGNSLRITADFQVSCRKHIPSATWPITNMNGNCLQNI